MGPERTLSALDAVFLHIEAAGTPMHMASIGIFEGGPLQDANGQLRLSDLRHLISSRLHLVPKLRQRPRPGLLREAAPTWIDDPTFDIENHVREEHLRAPGTEAELLELCGNVLAARLEATKPLWELVFVTGLDGGRVALIEKLHHSMADGVAAAELATVLLDLSPESPQVQNALPWIPQAPTAPLDTALTSLGRLLTAPVRMSWWLGDGVIHPVRRAHAALRALQSTSALLPSHLVAHRTSLNRQIGPRRKVNFVRFDLHGVMEVAHHHGATVNDVILAIVSGGLHALFSSRGELAESHELQALVPVGLEMGAGRQMGNGVSAFFVRLPVGQADSVKALATIASTTAKEKQEHQELAPALILRLLDPLPQSVLAAGSRLLRYQPLFNLVVTNVPGPSMPLYALGARMLEAFPVVPLVGNQGLGVAALSYVDQLNLGIFSDPSVCPDVQVFCEGARVALDALIGT